MSLVRLIFWQRMRILGYPCDMVSFAGAMDEANKVVYCRVFITQNSLHLGVGPHPSRSDSDTCLWWLLHLAATPAARQGLCIPPHFFH